VRPYLKKPITKKRASGVAQGVHLKFKPQYHHQKKKKKEKHMKMGIKEI
jgi:hypothetical protein